MHVLNSDHAEIANNYIPKTRTQPHWTSLLVLTVIAMIMSAFDDHWLRTKLQCGIATFGGQHD